MPAVQMRNVVVVDSGPLLALFDRDDAHLARVRQALKRNQGLRLLTTWPVLTETSALLLSRVGKGTEIEFLDWVAAGGVTVADLRHAWEIYSAPCFGITELPQIRVQNKRSHPTMRGYFSAPSMI